MVPHTADAEPIPDVSGVPVFTADGYRLGAAVDVGVDVDAGRATALYVTDVETDAFRDLETGGKGLRVPYRYVRGLGDAVVLRVSLARAEGAGNATAEDGSGDAPGSSGSGDGSVTGADREAVEADGAGTTGGRGPADDAGSDPR